MRISILGCGVMGQGIIALFAKSEKCREVVWWSRSEESLNFSFQNVKKDLKRFARKNKYSSSEVEELFAKIIFKTDILELGACDLYIEAVVENMSVKKQLLKSISGVIPINSIVATNTSSLSITELSMCLKDPSSFIGLHFFNPTSIMKLVEVVKGLATSEVVLEKIISIVKMTDKQAVVVNDSPGFIVNRMLIPMINEAVSILAEKIATKEDIDKAMLYGANHPIGPLALADLIGNDVCLSIMETIYNETGDSKYRAHPLLRKYVRAGFLGRKTGTGFYEYKKVNRLANGI